MKVTRKIVSSVCLLLNVAVAFCLLLADLAPYISPVHWTFPALLGLVYEAFVIANLCFVFLWLFTSTKWRALFSAFCLLLSIASIHNTMAFACSPKVEGETTHSLRVLSYNTHRMDGVAKPDQNRILHYLQNQEADVVCLQEFETHKDQTFLTLQQVKKALTQYPYSYIDFKEYKGVRQYGLAVFSKYPLLHKHTLRYLSPTNISNGCDVVVGADTIRLFNNHLQSNRLSESELASLDFTDNSSAQVKQATWSVTSKLRKGYQYRVPQADSLVLAAQNSPYPVIMCGDFNDVPVSFVYHRLTRHLQDAFLSSASLGTGHTFKNKNIGLRIDYILHSDIFQVSQFEIDRQPFSDHYPIACTFRW